MLNSGLGQTIDSYEVSNSVYELEDFVNKLKDRFKDSVSIKDEMSTFSIDNGWLIYGEESLVDLDDSDYEKLCKLLQIPSKYLLRLPQTMKKSNIDYWLDYFGDKEIELIYSKDAGIISIEDDVSIRPIDVLEIVSSHIPNAKIFKIVHQTNAVQYDVYSESLFYETDRDGYFGGLRVVIKNGLNAPDVSPIFLNVNTCAIIECSAYLEKMNLKSLSYKDILRVISERIDFCMASLRGLFDQFLSISDIVIKEPSRRIALYCREHSVPDRVKAYAISTFMESAYLDTTFEDIVCLFSVLGYVDEIKQSSERKLQQLAGYIISKTKTEERCTKCDATLVQE